MKILFLTDNFPPEVNAPATRTYEHCREWIKQGAEVTVITCFPNFPQGKVYEGYKNKLYQKEIIDGITVIRIWTYITSNEGFFKRVLDHISFAVMASIVGLFQRKISVIIATSPQFFTTFAGYFLALLKRKKWVFEVRDMWPEGIIFMKKNSMTYKILEKIEIFLYKKSDAIITVTESFKKNISIRAKVNEDKISIIYNGSNPQLFKSGIKNTALIQALSLENKFIFGYIGTLGVSHDLDFILSQLSTIYEKQPDIHFLIIGNGAVKEQLKAQINSLNLQNITLLPSIPKEEVPNYLSILDIGLVPLKKNDAYLKVIPSKIFELAAMSKPILLGVDGESKEIINKYSAGTCYEPSNACDFVEKVIAFYNQKERLTLNYSHGLAKLAQDFDRTYLATKMYSILKQLDD
jgi:glycosyltransferase involved in cell wall biosynthesis